MERIAKIIAASGICSRRAAEDLVFSGRIVVNGVMINHPSVKVNENDEIKIDNKVIIRNVIPKIYLYNKPIGVITTSKDTHNRETVFQNIKKNCPTIKERLIYVGRLDINSSGLLILTNTPKIASFLEKSKFERIYKVRISGILSINQIKQIKKGITIDGVRYFGIKDISHIHSGNVFGKNRWIKITLTEGKNREIRKIINHFGFSVSKLIRTNYYKFELGNLPNGRIIEANKSLTKEILNMINL